GDAAAFAAGGVAANGTVDEGCKDGRVNAAAVARGVVVAHRAVAQEGPGGDHATAVAGPAAFVGGVAAGRAFGEGRVGGGVDAAPLGEGGVALDRAVGEDHTGREDSATEAPGAAFKGQAGGVAQDRRAVEEGDCGSEAHVGNAAAIQLGAVEAHR